MAPQTQPPAVFAGAAGWGFCLHSAVAGQTPCADAGQADVGPSRCWRSESGERAGAGGAKDCLSRPQRMGGSRCRWEPGPAQQPPAVYTQGRVQTPLSLQLWESLVRWPPCILGELSYEGAGDSGSPLGPCPRCTRPWRVPLLRRVQGLSVSAPFVCLFTLSTCSTEDLRALTRALTRTHKIQEETINWEKEKKRRGTEGRT